MGLRLDTTELLEHLYKVGESFNQPPYYWYYSNQLIGVLW